MLAIANHLIQDAVFSIPERKLHSFYEWRMLDI